MARIETFPRSFGGPPVPGENGKRRATAAAQLDQLFSEHLGQGGFAVEGGPELFMEVTDRETNLVRISTCFVTCEDSQEIIGRKPHPGANIGFLNGSGPVFLPSGDSREGFLQREIGGRLGINVAAPVGITPLRIG